MAEQVGKFIQIAAAGVKNGYTLLYALDNQGVVWLYTEGDGHRRYWEPLENSREQPVSKDN